MEKSKMNEFDSNNKGNATIAKMSFFTDGNSKNNAALQEIIDFFKHKCALEYHTPFEQINSEDGTLVTIEFGVPIEKIEEVQANFEIYVDNLNTQRINFSIDSNIMDIDSIALELKKRRIEEIYKQYSPNDLNIVKDIIQKGDPKRIAFLHRLLIEYQPENISFSTLVNLKHNKIFDYDEAEKSAKDYYDFKHRKQNNLENRLPVMITATLENKKADPPVKAQTNNNIDYLEEFPLATEQADGIIRLEYGDIINYIDGDNYQDLKVAIGYDMPYFTEKLVDKKSPNELALMLTDFLLNYKGLNAEKHLHYLCGDNSYLKEKILNSIICDIPIIEFAKLNSEDLAKILIQYGCNESISTPKSENQKYISTVARMFGFGEEAEVSVIHALDLARALSGYQVGKQVK